MPVLPEVGSISVVLPGVILPSASSVEIMCTPMRSLTLASGLKNSSLARRLALRPFAASILRRRTSGVLPIVSVIDSKMRPRLGASKGAEALGWLAAVCAMIFAPDWSFELRKPRIRDGSSDAGRAGLALRAEPFRWQPSRDFPAVEPSRLRGKAEVRLQRAETLREPLLCLVVRH